MFVGVTQSRAAAAELLRQAAALEKADGPQWVGLRRSLNRQEATDELDPDSTSLIK